MRVSIKNHPDRERIEHELALCRNVAEVAARYGLNRRTLSAYRQNRMTAEQIARIRGMSPTDAEVNIEELVRKGGEDAVIGLSRLVQECKDQAEKCDKLGLHREASVYRRLQLTAYVEKAKIAALYPGKRTVNNTLVVGDSSAIFDMVAGILSRATDIGTARHMLAEEYKAMAMQRPALEHGAHP